MISFITKYRNSNKISGNKLARELDSKIYTPKLRRVPKIRRGVLVNWGLSKLPEWCNDFTPIINHSNAVTLSSNKLLSLKCFERDNVPTIPFTESREHAEELIGLNYKVVCRTLLSASSGRGIIIARSLEEMVSAPLYTTYIEKKWEYRVHVAFGNVIHTQQKRRLSSEELERRGITERNKYIRNLDNGYIFSAILDHDEDNLTLLNMRRISIDAVNSLGLDFGAVDLLVTKNGNVLVLEVNSAPGLEGSTLFKYVESFKERFNL